MLSRYSLQTLAKIHLSLPQITKLMGQDCSYDGSLKLPIQINPKEITKQDKLYGNLELVVADIFPDEVPTGWENPFKEMLEAERKEREREAAKKAKEEASQSATVASPTQDNSAAATPQKQEKTAT
eukprot:TRINITY_DN18970_c0_g1_i1.p3 TRINITY_DN18970_c0_g1~~TRINITY_DN18970_c0_g1_i1.p3  ORF type:complete len:133 (-),score=28.71 TRINITY_DN18970_c0_g1_i1:492-869(-)